MLICSWAYLVYFKKPNSTYFILGALLFTICNFGKTRWVRIKYYLGLVISLNIILALLLIFSNNLFVVSTMIAALMMGYGICCQRYGLLCMPYWLTITIYGIIASFSFQLGDYQILFILININLAALICFCLNHIIFPSKLFNLPFELNRINYNTLLYSVRISLATITAYIFIAYYQIQHGPWILYTILAVSLINFGLTIDKIINRLMGTIIGACVGSFILQISFQYHLLWLSFLIPYMAMAFLIYASLNWNYAISLMCTTILIAGLANVIGLVFPQANIGISVHTFYSYRLINIVLGAIIVLVFSILLPNKNTTT